MKKDIVLTYGISKLSATAKHDTGQAIRYLVRYVQNAPIYYDMEPTVVDGVICFTIVGFKRDHHRFQNKLSKKLRKAGCKLVWSDTATKI